MLSRKASSEFHGGPYPKALRSELGVAAETSEKRLFTKNTGPCEAVRRCIRTDACPVLER